MSLHKQLEKLAKVSNTPCLTISFNTHRSHPDNEKDDIKLKNYISKAEKELLDKYDKREISKLLDKLGSLEKDIDSNYNLESIHIFISNDEKEIIRLERKTEIERYVVSESFVIRPLIKNYTKERDYYIMVLSQGGVDLYEASDEAIVNEIKNEDFPYPESGYYAPNAKKKSDPKYMDSLIREYLNNVDKAFVDIYNEAKKPCVVICTADNYNKLLEVANRPEAYLGFASIDYNNTDKDHITEQAYKLIIDKKNRKAEAAIASAEEVVSQGRVLTDLQEIYKASIDGLGQILIVSQDYKQSVVFKDERNFEIAENVSDQQNTTDDIVSKIAWEVWSKDGEVIFTDKEKLNDFGDILLIKRF
ncbi:hypothetical protein C7377_1489 [Balneicella halophila]|uniref:ERF1-like protein n=1 Tax=Balneicella halophila TaxID=1537566 RepID=A0A7L4UMK7_BALHA|nr:hypothetical protein [Balneicella halophila]PVX49851.1 hypothetical protein C7377_1489 [Balneicella halophila]